MNAVPGPGASRAELTLRGLLIGVVITLVFTAANVFFGLKAGLTFATSIPAAVISMALLRMTKDATMQENNIVQTVASAAGTLSSIIFVLPGLVMIGWWNGFPYWTSLAICALGGTLGVMYSIPLRRALVTNSDLPYPEGVACAEVLKVGAEAEGQEAGDVEQTGRAGLMAVVVGSLVSAAFAVVVATRLFASDIAQYFRTGDRSVSGYDFNLSFALFAVGHLCGIWVGLAMLLGVFIGWGWAVPHFSPLHWGDALSPETIANTAWAKDVRFLGAGMIGVAAIWTLAKLVKPVISGLASAMASSRARAAGQGASLARTELDIPVGIVGMITLLCMIPIAWMLGNFSVSSGLGSHLWLLAIGGVLFVVLMSFFVSTVCGYMAGLIGSSNSPLSGVGIIVVIVATFLLLAGVHDAVSPESKKALVAFALFVTAVVFAVAAIANNNLQDLKTGQLVDATPWKQQVALVIGVVVGAAIIPPVLELVNKAYGFAGMPGVDPQRALAAPQAALISALAQGVIQHNLNWTTIGIGALVGIALIVLDETLGRTTKSVRLPPLAAGLGIYLPTSTSLMIVVGAVVGWYFDRRADRTANPEAAKQLGVLLASGMIVGESIIGVLIAIPVVVLNKAYPLALVGDSFGNASLWLGGIAFAGVIFAMYRWIDRIGQRRF